MVPYSQRPGLRLAAKEEKLPAIRHQLEFDALAALEAVMPLERVLPCLPIVRDQTDITDPSRDVPCCVSMAIIHSIESLDAGVPPAAELSVLFHFFEATGGTAQTLTIFDGIRAAIRTGVCRFELHNPEMSFRGAMLRPTNEAFVDVEQRRLEDVNPVTYTGGYARLAPYDPRQWTQGLALGYPIIIGFWMTPAYDALCNSDIHAPSNLNARTAGHAVACIGYSTQKQAFLIKDSRGPTFGRSGYWWLPFQRLSEGFIVEAWAIRSIGY